MRKFLYYTQVFFVSFELLVIFFGFFIFKFWEETISITFSTVTFNEEAMKWLVVFPIGIAAWTLREGTGVLFPDEKTTKILHEWPDYWKLKAHFHIGIFFCIFLTIPCLLIWLFNKLENFEAAWFFGIFAIALMINAYSFYSAKIELKSKLIHLK